MYASWGPALFLDLDLAPQADAATMPPKPVLLFGMVPVPAALVGVWNSMQPFIRWFQQATAG